MDDLASLLSQLRRSFTASQVEPEFKSPKRVEAPASTISLDRPLSEEESAVAKWLLLHGAPDAIGFLPQLEGARVTGKCSCGCPTVDIRVADGTPRAEPKDNPVAEVFGKVDGNLVGVMLLQRDGYLTCLEVYDLSEIAHPYGLLDTSSLEPAVWSNKG